MKTYIGLSRDHSASMRQIAKAAAKDYNTKIEAIKEASVANKQDTVVSVVECGYGNTDKVKLVVTNSSPVALQPIDNYIANGYGTPLYDSIGALIELFEKMPDANDPEVSFLVMAITDGYENASNKYNSTTLIRKINQLIATDRWSFVLRVPRGMKAGLVRIGFHEGNILEWDQTDAGTHVAAQTDTQAFGSYFAARSTGVTKTTSFYSNLENVTSEDVEAALDDISKEILVWPVTKADDGVEIRKFVEDRTGGEPYLKGAAFYELTKIEPKVQDNKKILIRDRNTQSVYYGTQARKMLGLPAYGNIRLRPGHHGNFDVYIQSTSVNRKMDAGTSLIYWKNVGTRFKEGPSAR